MVWSTNLFYKGSAAWDVVNSAYPNQGLADDNAIATDKTYYAGGVPATFANVSNYSAGINGLMVDIGFLFAGGGPHGTLTASDFIFKVGNNNSLSTWAAAPVPFSVTTRTGMGVLGSDRVEITWANNAIQNEWLEVQVARQRRSRRP